MVRTLIVFTRGERQVLSEVRVPTVEQDVPVGCCASASAWSRKGRSDTNRIKGLLKTQGIMDFDPRGPLMPQLDWTKS
jgi:transposase